VTATSITRIGRHPYLLAATGLLLLRSLLAPFALLLPGSDEIPAAAVVITMAIAALVLVGVWAIWQGRKWGGWLVIILTALDVLTAIPAFLEQPSGWLVAAAALGVLTGVPAIVLTRHRAVWSALR